MNDSYSSLDDSSYYSEQESKTKINIEVVNILIQVDQ